MLLLRSVELCDDQELKGSASVTAPDLAWNGGSTSLFAVEMAAQAAAYHSSLPAQREGAEPAQKGYLVRLRAVECAHAMLQADLPYEVSVMLQGAAANLAVYAFSVSARGPSEEAVVTGTLSIMRAS